MTRVVSEKLSEFIPYIAQLFLFLFFIIPHMVSTFNPTEFFIIIIFEISGFLPLFYKIKRRYSYLVWIIQLFTFSIISILFHFKRTFNVENPSPTLFWFFLIPVILFTVICILYLFYGERIVKSVLLGLASSTALIVLLIIVFISYEAIPAFQENDPVDFITGTEWKSMYEETLKHSKTVQTVIESSNFSIFLERPSLYLKIDTIETTPITVHNNAGRVDSFTINTLSNTLEASLEEINIIIPPYQSKIVNLTINASDKGSHKIDIQISSQFDSIQKKELNIIVSDHAINLDPYSFTLDSGLYAMSLVNDYTLTNKGEENDIITVTLIHGDKFRPYIRCPTWNYENSSATFTLSPLESVTFTVDANLVQLAEGTHDIIIEARSSINPSIVLNSTFSVYYEEQKTIRVIPQIKSITVNGTAIYEIILEKGATDQLGIEITGPNGWETTLFNFQNETLLENYGIVNISFNESDDRSKIIYLATTPQNLVIGNSATFGITVIDWGTKPVFGILPFIVGTILTTILAILIATPIGLASAMFLSEYTPRRLRNILRPIYELLAGIPSVIYGLWGVMTLGPYLSNNVYPFLIDTIGKIIPIFEPTTYIGRDVFTASIVLAIMILPIIITLSEDAIRSVRRDLKEGSLALGTTRWQTLIKMILPQAKPGIIASIILATGRAIGETMAVLMIMGLVVKIPSSLFDSTSTMTGIIANTFNWAYDIAPIRHALFAVALILFVMVFILNIIIFKIEKGQTKKEGKRKFNLFDITKKNKKNNTDSEKKSKSFIILEERPVEKKFKIISETKQTITQSKIMKYRRTQKYFPDNAVSSIKKARIYEKIGVSILITFSIIASIFLFFILFDVISKGLPVFKLEYLTEIESMGGIQGGFLNAIVGSLYLVGISLLLATPLSIGAAIYIQEYAKKTNLFTRTIMFASDTLASTPSIVYGAFGFMFFIITLGFRWSLLIGGITLGIMIIPLMLRSSIEAIRTVTDDLREGSYALGATQWQTIVKVVIPTAIAGIISGIILSMGRAIGETAAVLLTAGYAREIPGSLLHQAASLPNMIYNYFEFAARTPALMDKLYAVAFVLIIIVLILNTISRLIGYRYSRMIKN
jgi:phosphate transport system permease protein